MTRRTGGARRLTVGRGVAIGLVVTVAAGLAAVRLFAAGGSVSVPAGARAGQLLQRHPCTYPTEDGHQDAECGILVVPENRTAAHSRLIAVPVTRVRAHGGASGAPVFYLAGGPGQTNMVFPQASRFTPNHDVVLVGYRGVDGSTRLDCPEVTAALAGAADLTSPATLRAYSAAYRGCAGRLTAAGVDLLGYNPVERVDDFEAARQAFGYHQVNLVSDSAGTRTAMLYAWRHPASINRSVMLGADPPGHFLYDGPTTDRLISQYAQLCAADAACRRRTADLAGTMRTLLQNLPRRWGPFAIKPGNVKAGTQEALFEATTAPMSAPDVIDAWLAAAHGDASGLWFASLLADVFVAYMPFVWGDAPATGQLDDQAGRAYYAAGGDHGTILGNALTDLFSGGGIIDAGRTRPRSTRTARCSPPTCRPC